MEVGAAMGSVMEVGEVTAAGVALDVLPRTKPNLLHKLGLKLMQRLSAGVAMEAMEAMVSEVGAVMVSAVGEVTGAGAVMDVLPRVRANLKLTANATTEEEDVGADVGDVVADADAEAVTTGEHTAPLFEIYYANMQQPVSFVCERSTRKIEPL